MLAEHFGDPEAYVRSLHYLLDFYADRSRHTGKSGSPPPITPAYKVRPPVLRMILQELTPLALENPNQGLELCEVLWNEPYLEFHLLAAMLIGQIDPIQPDSIIQRLKKWLTPDLEFYLIEALMEHSLNRIRKEHPRAMIQLIQDWLGKKDLFFKQLGLRALLPLIKDPDFQNIPVFYRLIQPLTESMPSGLRPDLLDVLSALIQRSPQETAFFLEQALALPNSSDSAWLIRQSLTEFPADIQRSLREAIANSTTQI